MRIAIIDGQGGGVGCALAEGLRGKGHTLLALGTNALATAAMMRAGADEGATGENAICHTAVRCDVIAGPIGILAANALLGEVTPAMAAAIAGADAKKVLLPSRRCNIVVAGVPPLSMTQLIEDAVRQILEMGA